MSLGQKIFIYCERGQDPSFWAEPLNAVSNAAFLIAALVAARDYAATSPERRTPAALALVALTFVIGIGSFLFHTFATRWAALADTIPIALFMLAYFAFLLRRFLGLNWISVVLGVAAFYAAIRYAGTIQCSYGELLPITARSGARCLNGTVTYAPAFLALLGSAVVLARHPAGRAIGLAAVVFLASMTFRTLDMELCELSRLGGHLRGSHFMWHILNGLTLYILLRAAIRHGTPRLQQEEGARA
ncbi:ceramidase domain-containing protein [Hyphomicrobium sp.]|uniref:ceramidase domain-containing protein n=1 Tax=Hyphomicrobium sp. TaxID=82 RepID=UPI0025BC2794|nr:ceramidase domain-containing protein [Hyphomicrobium sp.]MCC7252574.1 ceramidase domain-containing protein [Hyphomicrobium sp.]